MRALASSIIVTSILVATAASSAMLAGCKRASGAAVGSRDGGVAEAAASTKAGGAEQARPLEPCPDVMSTEEAAPGLRVSRVRAAVAPDVAIGDRCVTVVRVDPARFRFKVLTAAHDGGPRPVTRWLDDFHLTGVINASMFRVDDRSTGLLVTPEAANNPDDNASFGGFLAFDPKQAGAPLAQAFGRGCAGFDLGAVRARYRTIVQNYRLLDCEGRAIAWKDEKIYSAAAVGTGRDGSVVLIHVRTPYAMRTLASILAAPALGIASAMFVEGGPEASLLVRAGGREVREVGSYESGFKANDENRGFWALPNVLGFLPR